MPIIKFTAAKIKSLKPTTKYVEYYDEGREPGEGAFGLRVSPNNKGKKSWFVLYRGNDKKQKRYTVGTTQNLTLKQARAAVTALNIPNGGDPVEEAKLEAQKAIDEAAAKTKAAGEHAARPTMKDLWKEYLKKVNPKEDPKKKVKKLAPSTLREYDRKWKMEVDPVMGDMAVADITPVFLADLLDDLAVKSPVAANRLHSFLSVLFKPAIRKGWINYNPLADLDKPAKEEPRERVLSDEEIKKLWGLLDQESENSRDTMRMMLLTAQRKGEIFKMHWKDIDSETMVWNQPTNKTGSHNLVPLSPQAMEIVNRHQRTCVPSWIFLSTRKDNCHIMGIKKARIKLNKLMGCEDNPWTEHDLRRTARTLLSRLEVKHHIRERVLNHSQDGMVKVYDQYDYLNEKRDALIKLADLIDKIVGNKPKPQGKIIKLQGVG